MPKNYLIFKILVLIFFIATFFSPTSDLEAKSSKKKRPKSNASASQPMDLLWYEPKILHTNVNGKARISLLGRAEANASVRIDLSQIITIRKDRAEKDTYKTTPPLTNHSTVASRRGLFELIFDLPYGMSQVPIQIKRPNEKPQPTLILFTVTKGQVKINAPTSKRGQKSRKKNYAKRSKKNKSQTKSTKYYVDEKSILSLGLGADFFIQTQSLDGLEEAIFKSVGVPNIHLGYLVNFYSWEAFLNANTVSLKSEDEVIGLPIIEKSQSNLRVLLGGSYLFNEEFPVWKINFGLSYIQNSISFFNSSNEVEIQPFNATGLDLGVEYNGYIPPVFLKVFLNYTTPLSIGTAADFSFEATSRLFVNGGVEMSYPMSESFLISFSWTEYLSKYKFKMERKTSAELNEGDYNLSNSSFFATLKYIL